MSRGPATEIRVADIDELPPGKGKLVHVGGRDFAIYNLEGRYHATRSLQRHIRGPLGAAAANEASVAITACDIGGHFDVSIEDSPARLHEESSVYEIVVLGRDIMLMLPYGDTRSPR